MAIANGTSLRLGFDDAQVTKETGIAFVACPEYRHRRKYNDHEIIKEESWHGTRYTGTAEALLRVCLIEEHMLPGRPGRNKTSVTLRSASWSAGLIDRVRIQKRTEKIYVVYVVFRKEEANRRWEICRKEMESERLKKRAEEVKKTALERLSFGLLLARNGLISEGYSFDDETLCDFEQLAEGLVDILENGEVIPTCQVAAGSVAIGLPKPQPDAQLQRFLQKVTSDFSLVQNEKQEGL